MGKMIVEQVMKILAIFSETPEDHIRNILSSKLLEDLRDGDVLFSEDERQELRKLLDLLPPNVPILQLAETFDIPRFSNHGSISVNTLYGVYARTKLLISGMNEKFKKLLNARACAPWLTTSNPEKSTINCNVLMGYSTESHVMYELGGMEKAVISMDEFWNILGILEERLMKELGFSRSARLDMGHGKREDNIFFVSCPGCHTICATRWFDGWAIEAFPQDEVHRFKKGSRVFSRVNKA